ncbi:MAG: bacterial transcriptional activator domain-containing protein, partial [Bacteroidetes bacterium]|nr:bacterial transcriptional activator domain-containing protein [Bacteroidota bacterium]
MSGFDHIDDDGFPRTPNDSSDDDVRRFRESLRNGSRDINSPEALEEIIQFYLDHEEFEEALQFAERLLSFEPFSSDAWQRKGMILNNLTRYADALSCYDRALSL